MRQEQIEFTNGGLRLFGMMHRPEPGADRKSGMVFCHPFGEERKSAYRAMVAAARALADDGFTVLLFDYRGCGDSEGEFREATLTAQMADIHAALAFLRLRAQINEVGLLGLRLGAALAARVAAEDASVKTLALWEPVLNGKAYLVADLRKKLIKEMMTAGKSTGKRGDILKSLERGEGEVDFDGYPITGALFREMAELDLVKQVGPFRGRVLMLQISFSPKLTPGIEALRKAYEAAGAQCSAMGVVEEPFWNRIELIECPGLIQTTRAWLCGESLAQEAAQRASVVIKA